MNLNIIANPSQLITEMFSKEAFQYAMETAEEKELDWKLIRHLSEPEYRNKMFIEILTESYEPGVSRIQEIPKDDKKNEFREVYIYPDEDRIVLSLINDALFKLFPDMVHSKCRSYQKGTGTQETVQKISREIQNQCVYTDEYKLEILKNEAWETIYSNTRKHRVYEMQRVVGKATDNKTKVSVGKKVIRTQLGFKADLSKYFDKVLPEPIENVFAEIEKRMGFEVGTEPVVNLLRKYYAQTEYYDKHKRLCHRYQGLKQGCAVASFLADVVLYDMDEFMSKKYKTYYRYSDDIVVIDSDTRHCLSDMNMFLSEKGVVLNPKKVEELYSDEWFPFLGFSLKENHISITKKRLDKFEKEVRARTIDRNCNEIQARKNVLRWLYGGEYNWATSCIGTINVEHDLVMLNNFVMNCIRACKTKKTSLYGLGYGHEQDHVVVFNTGKNVGENIKKMPEVENYYTILCMSNAYKQGKPVFEMLKMDMGVK